MLNLDYESHSLQYAFSYAKHFVLEFIFMMRASDECLDKPSPRQSLFMYRLLLLVHLKKGYLSVQDLVEVAVMTSRVENQNLAEIIAYEIILDYIEKEKTIPTKEPWQRPFPVATPIRKPVKEPGPVATTRQPISASSISSCRN